MPAKMMSEMPFPIPRSLICSPSHITKAQPVVSESTVTNLNPRPGLRTRFAPPGEVRFSRKNAMVVPWMIEMTTVP